MEFRTTAPGGGRRRIAQHVKALHRRQQWEKDPTITVSVTDFLRLTG